MENNSDQPYNHMENRDPYNKNEYIQVNWNNIINEPTGARSIDFSWKISNKIYSKSLNCCYKLLSAVFGPILALWWGLRFGCQSFMHIWCYQPFLSHLQIDFTCIRRMYIIILEATVVPWVKACSYCFSNVKVRYEKIPSPLSVAHRQERTIEREPSEKIYDDIRIVR